MTLLYVALWKIPLVKKGLYVNLLLRYAHTVSISDILLFYYLYNFNKDNTISYTIVML